MNSCGVMSQDALHNEESQHILIAGETRSGKSFAYRQILSHLLYLGRVSDEQKFVPTNIMDIRDNTKVFVIVRQILDPMFFFYPILIFS